MIISLITLSCGREINQDKFEYSLLNIDTIKIDVPTNIPEIAISDKWSYSNDILSFMTGSNNQTYLYCYQFDQQKFMVYRLSNLSKNLITHSASYGFIDDSTIVYDDYFKSELLVLSLNTGHVKKSYKYNELYGIAHNNTLKFYSDSLYFIWPFMYLKKDDPLFQSKTKLAMIVNKINNEKQIFGSYPSKIKINPESRLNLIIPDMICEKDKIVLNFRAEKELFVYSSKDSSIKSYPCKDPGVLQNKNIHLSGDDIMDALEEELYGLYKTLLYDKKFKRYYRISVSYPDFQGDIPNSEEELQYLTKSRKVTVTVLNENFQIMAQSTLLNITENNPFIKNGILYMRRNIISEEVMHFIGFKLVNR